jgi:hypothetical protein
MTPMDDSRLDALARALNRLSRRGLLIAVASSLAAALGVVAPEGGRGKKHRRRKKKCRCSVCQRCQGGRCRRAEGTPCRDCGICVNGVCERPILPPNPRCGSCATCESGGVCVPRANNSLCGGEGRCLNGVCNPLPNCDPAGTLPCLGGDAADCCSGRCCAEGGFTFCCESELGARCNDSEDCAEGLICVGFRCLVGS